MKNVLVSLFFFFYSVGLISCALNISDSCSNDDTKTYDESKPGISLFCIGRRAMEEYRIESQTLSLAKFIKPLLIGQLSNFQSQTQPHRSAFEVSNRLQSQIIIDHETSLNTLFEDLMEKKDFFNSLDFDFIDSILSQDSVVITEAEFEEDETENRT